mmetsp:Transcript_31706/g.67191  ORF Transcript_31706/g.67191 Transcript_31706/m.67191 type:complete len:277 (-) Transcript_31706:528-1358(-)
MGGHHPDRQRTTPLHPKAWSRRNPTLVILSICIFVQTIFIILSKSNITTTHGNLQTGLNLNNKNADNHLEKVKNDETNPKNLPSKAQQSKHPYPYAKTLEETVTNPKRQVKEFERQNDAVIVTKIHGRHNLITLEQSLCLLHYAYNQRLQYNIIVFYSDDLDEKDMITSRKIVKPVNISFVKDTPPLQEVLITLPEKRRQNLLTRCQAKKTKHHPPRNRLVDRMPRENQLQLASRIPLLAPLETSGVGELQIHDVVGFRWLSDEGVGQRSHCLCDQ